MITPILKNFYPNCFLENQKCFSSNQQTNMIAGSVVAGLGLFILGARQFNWLKQLLDCVTCGVGLPSGARGTYRID